MSERRPTNFELRLNRLDDEESEREEEPGILELFHTPEAVPDEDAPVTRDDAWPSSDSHS